MPCKYCGEPIKWLKIDGKWKPFEVSDTLDEGELIEHNCRS